MFEGRTFRCQSSAVIEMPSRWEISPWPAKCSFSSWSLSATSSTRRVDLAGEEVALAEGAEDLGELLPPLGDELEHEQRRDRPRVGLVEVAEVVVAADLAGEDGVHLAHAVLDERVADAVHQRRAAEPLDDVADGPAGAHVVDDRPARLLLEHRLGEERGDEVARDELARVVDEEAAVGVAVEGDAEVGALLAAPCRR